eukprot:TRINITY_DN2765_c0_g3_i1.p1 TRINITY_DN2765_c0_g3~~TRINITY_DN2765_c0_g3_i1.p1  ORF type:complete len:183 (+),score=52.37 TRINITY_DN2765_c0_g3_i1:52-600(+)
MIRLIKKKEEQKTEEPGQGQGQGLKPSVLRVQKDITTLGQDLKDHIKYTFDPSNLLKMELIITPPKDSLWEGGSYKMILEFPEDYPFNPPKATCMTKIYHPNIEYTGGVCSNILRKDWSAALNLQVIFNALLNLFVEPVADDPLNREAGELLFKNYDEFRRVVKETLRGRTYGGQTFPKFIS